MSKNICVVCETIVSENRVCIECEPTFLQVYEYITRQDPEDLKDMDPFESSVSLAKCRLHVNVKVGKEETIKNTRVPDTPEAKAKRWEETLAKYKSGEKA